MVEHPVLTPEELAALQDDRSRDGWSSATVDATFAREGADQPHPSPDQYGQGSDSALERALADLCERAARAVGLDRVARGLLRDVALEPARPVRVRVFGLFLAASMAWWGLPLVLLPSPLVPCCCTQYFGCGKRAEYGAVLCVC